ncbi:hypothetical protein MNU23_31070 [Pseudomonas aeruginosa]|uniref:hypothetical protein n=1 Tax=Pseudomonas aeruginosa TaxID=287 RepID=UPI0021A510DC|nr:hypothetical protein [Pseudomonas aeruginosa]MCT2416122.1 hypothetical protein [Pseudomonas aeruginosa]
MQRISSALRKEMAADLATGSFDITENGIAFPRLSVLAGGDTSAASTAASGRRRATT